MAGQGPFFDGYSDGLLDRDDHAHLHVEGRAAEKYAEGRGYGVEDRAAGALEPSEPLS